MQTDKKASNQLFSFSETADLEESFLSMCQAMRLFTHYVPRDVVKEMLMSGETEGGTSFVDVRTITIIFFDIVNFTTMCEGLSTGDLVPLAESYFHCVTRTLMSHGCTIDKYIGDAVMGFWGAPLDWADARVQCLLRRAAHANSTQARSKLISWSTVWGWLCALECTVGQRWSAM